MRYLDKIGIIVILVGVILLVWFGYIFPQLHKTTVDGHECIDLGLPSGTLWATCNIGAETPYEYGDYYAWGETTTKSTFAWSTYKYCNGKRYTINKYNTDTTYGPVLDTLTRLTPTDDVVTQKWGKNWCMPTNEQIRELNSCCKVGSAIYRGKHYCKIIGPNNQQLILPYSGWKIRQKLKYIDSTTVLWSRDLRLDKSEMAYILVETWGTHPGWTKFTRNAGFSVRGVVKKEDE